MVIMISAGCLPSSVPRKSDLVDKQHTIWHISLSVRLARMILVTPTSKCHNPLSTFLSLVWMCSPGASCNT